jgi:hypothetical protein
MISRGYIVGKIVDDLAGLKYQVETRNRLQLFDLTKFCEDFFKDLLNIVYSLNLTNLNTERSNNPGIDLGDSKKPIAFQVTSTKTSQKVTDTLEKLTQVQIDTYININVFIVGSKQGSYTIDQALIDKTQFNVDANITDVDDLLKDIVVLETEKLDEIFSLFKREFRQLKIELEPIDSQGNFQSSLYNQLEVTPNRPPLNASKLADRFDEDDVNLASIQELYKKLLGVPRVTRELLAIIADKGKFKGYNHDCHEWGILPQVLKNFLKMSDDELQSELAILEDAGLIYYGEDCIGEKLFHYVTLSWYTLNEVVNWAKENDISLRRLFNTMDFSELDG